MITPRNRSRRRAVGPAAGICLLAIAASGCGGGSGGLAPIALRSGTAGSLRANRSRLLIVRSPVRLGPAWQAEASVNGRVAVWTASRSGASLMRIDQQFVHLALHAGRIDPGGGRWRYGDHVGTTERSQIVAAFNGGFKFSYGSIGFFADGRTGAPLQPGLASVVTYASGITDNGTWRAGVPAGGGAVTSVRQNLRLLVDHGQVASTAATCIQRCWGGTVAYLPSVARSALGIDGAGRLVWAAGEHLSAVGLGRALVAAGAVRALELDINPKWVAGYLYIHRGRKLAAVPVVPGQVGVYGRFLKPYSRDFMTILAN